MSMFIETKSNEKIRADANAAGDYITTTNGYVPDYLFEVGVSSSGTEINVTSGMIIQDGIKVIINSPEIVEVGREASGTYEYKLYLKIKMNEPENPEFVHMRSNITPQKDNVFSNMNAGVNHIEIATFTRNTSGVAGLRKTLPKSSLRDGSGEIILYDGNGIGIGQTVNLGVTPEELRKYTLNAQISANTASTSPLNVVLTGSNRGRTSTSIRLGGVYESGTGYGQCLLALTRASGTTYNVVACRVTYSANNANSDGKLFFFSINR